METNSQRDERREEKGWNLVEEEARSGNDDDGKGLMLPEHMNSLLVLVDESEKENRMEKAAARTRSGISRTSFLPSSFLEMKIGVCVCERERQSECLFSGKKRMDGG